MDKQSNQPMLGGSKETHHELQIEAGKVSRKESENTLFQKKRSKGLLVGLIITIILCLILFIALCVSLFRGNDLCLTQQCLRTASNLLQSIDYSVDPCDDFYKFTCGRWKDERLIRSGTEKINWYTERGELKDQIVKDFLTKSDDDDDPASVVKARAMYRSCLDTDSMDENGFSTLISLMQKLGFTAKPPIYPKKHWDWIGNVAKARKLLDMQIIIGFSLNKLPTNRSITKLSINIPQVQDIISLKNKKNMQYNKIKEINGDDYIDEEKENEVIEETFEFLKYFYLKNNLEVNDDQKKKLMKAAEDIISLHSTLTLVKKRGEKEEEKVIPKSMTVYELQQLVDKPVGRASKIRWMDYFNKVYENTTVTDVRSGLEKNESILVYNEYYYTNLSVALSKFSERQIGLYIWWQITFGLALHVDSDLIELRKAIDLSAGYEHVSREQLCVITITTVMKPALYYVVHYLPNLEEKYERVEEMILNIKDAFKSLVKKLKWMDDTTKERAMDKVDSMEAVVSFPDWMNNYDNFDTFYENVTVKEDMHLKNLLQTFEEDALSSLQSLREIDDSIGAGLDPLEVNAYYVQQDNLIYVPVMILQFPFYDLGLEALNYGSIGAIIGHEVTHGFDNSGRFFDKDGNYFQWWTKTSDKEYKERAECFVNRYGSYNIEAVNKSVDGHRTLGENLADSGGLIAGYLSYKKYVEDHGEEANLPHFENYTHEQLFFLSYVHTWCTEYENSDGILSDLDDEHSPEFVRTFMTLQLSEEFSRVWNCPKGSNMNPDTEKCKLWYDEK